jgi:hypothetical protein
VENDAAKRRVNLKFIASLIISEPVQKARTRGRVVPTISAKDS